MESSLRDRNARPAYLPPKKSVCRSRRNRTRHGRVDWLQLRKEYIKAVYCHLVYLTYAEYIMRNAGINEAQAGIKIAGRNINNLRYADDTTLMAESGKELKSLFIK